MEGELEKIAYVYGDVCVRTKKQRRKRQKLLVIEMLYDYAKNSTLHGLRYIVERGLSTVEKLNERERIKYNHISAMCEVVYIGKNRTENVSFVTDITEVALTPYDIFNYCRWYNKYKDNCTELFRKVYTEDGVCYTANALAATEILENTTQQEYPYLESNISSKGWSITSGYDYSLPDNYPRRGRILGAEPDLEIILEHDPAHRDTLCNELYSGYKIYLHHPADIPQSSLYYYAALPNQLTSLAISFHEFNTDPSLSAYSPDK